MSQAEGRACAQIWGEEGAQLICGPMEDRMGRDDMV